MLCSEILILTFLIFTPLEHKVLSYTLTDLAFQYTPHMDLQLISQNIHKEFLLPITSAYYTSFYNKEKQNSSISSTQQNTLSLNAPKSTPRYREEFKSVQSLLKVESVGETLQMMDLIGTSSAVLKNEAFPSLVVIWPESPISEERATAILNSEPFQKSSRGFNIASELLIGFLKSLKTSTELSSTSTEEFLFYEVFNINNRHIAQKLDAGTIHFKCNFCRGPAIRRTSFYGLMLNVTAVDDPELNDDIKFEKNAAGDLIFSSEGFSGRILQILQQSLNFTVKAMKSGHWGMYVPANKSWVGSVKDITDGRANLGIAVTVMRANRAEQISFLPAADETVISAFFRNPDLNAVRDIFAQPFKLDLWAAVFSTWIILAFFMILFTAIRKRYDMHDNVDGTEPDFAQDSFIWALATACQQGWDDHPVAGSLRTIFISGSFTGVVAYAGYSAAIVSTLSLRVDPIQNPEQLLRSSLAIGIRQGFITELLQQNNTKDIITSYQQKLTGSTESERYMNITAGYRHLLKHRYAFISTRDNMYDNLKVTTNDTDICALRELQLLKRGFPTGHFVAKNSPYKEFLRYIYVTIREPGISWKLRGNYTYRRRCLEASDNAGQALGANDVFTAFMILSAGYVLSVTFVVIEKLYRVGKTFSYIR